MRRQGSRGAKSRRAPRKALTRVELEAMAQAATIDCYNESEEITLRPVGSEWIEAYRRWLGGG
jgi:hypothetical protein